MKNLLEKIKKPLHELDINMWAMRLALSNCQTSIDISLEQSRIYTSFQRNFIFILE